MSEAIRKNLQKRVREFPDCGADAMPSRSQTLPTVQQSGTDCPAHGDPPRAGQVLGTPTQHARTGTKRTFFRTKKC